MNRKEQHWSRREIRELILIYKKYPLEDVARRLDRTPQGVFYMVRKLRKKGNYPELYKRQPYERN